MLVAKHYITFWEVKLPDGAYCEVELRMTPIGSYNIAQAQFLTHLLGSLRVDNDKALRTYTGEQLKLAF